MSPTYKQRIAERKKRKEAEARRIRNLEKRFESWKEELPVIPEDVKNHLDDSCKAGLMAFLTFITTDPDALSKLIEHTQYRLRYEADRLPDEIKELENQLATKKAFLDSISQQKKVPKPRVLKTA